VRRATEPQDYKSPREHVELLGAVERVQAHLAKLATPIWIAAVGALVAAVVLISRCSKYRLG
jgi:hypothetical protein